MGLILSLHRCSVSWLAPLWLQWRGPSRHLPGLRSPDLFRERRRGVPCDPDEAGRLSLRIFYLCLEVQPDESSKSKPSSKSKAEPWGAATPGESATKSQKKPRMDQSSRTCTRSFENFFTNSQRPRPDENVEHPLCPHDVKGPRPDEQRIRTTRGTPPSDPALVRLCLQARCRAHVTELEIQDWTRADSRRRPCRNLEVQRSGKSVEAEHVEAHDRKFRFLEKFVPPALGSA